MKVELLYFENCPGYAELRERLPSLLERVGVVAEIEERRVRSEQAAQRERFLGSPTLRIAGRDIDRGATGRRDYSLGCRLYLTDDGLQQTPPDARIASALRTAHAS